MSRGSDQGARDQALKRARVLITPTLGFSKEDKEGTFQLHDDVLVVTIKIGGYDVKRVLVDQGSEAKIMYLNLYKGLSLKPEDLERYDSPLIGAYSPYIAILTKPQLHAIGVVSSTLHLKVNFSTHKRMGELVGSQAMARQCLVSTIAQHPTDPVVVARDQVSQ